MHSYTSTIRPERKRILKLKAKNSAKLNGTFGTDSTTTVETTTGMSR